MPGPRVLRSCGLQEPLPTLRPYHTQLIHIHGNRAQKPSTCTDSTPLRQRRRVNFCGIRSTSDTALGGSCKLEFREADHPAIAEGAERAHRRGVTNDHRVSGALPVDQGSAGPRRSGAVPPRWTRRHLFSPPVPSYPGPCRPRPPCWPPNHHAAKAATPAVCHQSSNPKSSSSNHTAAATSEVQPHTLTQGLVACAHQRAARRRRQTVHTQPRGRGVPRQPDRQLRSCSSLLDDPPPSPRLEGLDGTAVMIESIVRVGSAPAPGW